MKKIVLTLFFLTGFFGYSYAVEFAEGMEDFPIMEDLEQVESDSISFGNEESRFIETYLSGTVSFEKVKEFYINNLPQLGWMLEKKEQNTLLFYRDNEVIEIAKEKTNPLLVRITLKSRG